MCESLTHCVAYYMSATVSVPLYLCHCVCATLYVCLNFRVCVHVHATGCQVLCVSLFSTVCRGVVVTL